MKRLSVHEACGNITHDLCLTCWACHPQGDLDEFQDKEYTFLGRRRPLHDFAVQPVQRADTTSLKKKSFLVSL